jgi:hypothetical protein
LIRIISLGAGVQSTTLALMAAGGDIASPDAAIFADTGWEPAAVYRHLAKLEAALPFPVIRVSAGNLRDDAIVGASKRTSGKRLAAIPWFIRNPDGSEGMGRRQCTTHYKVEPIRKQIVAMLGGRPKGGAEMWIGISTNEAFRMKPSQVQYIVNRWPLIERGMNRNDCRGWLTRHGWDAPRSSCIGCPFHSDEEWRNLSKAEMAEAVMVDEAIRHQPGFKGSQYAHRSMIPLSQVAFDRAPDLFGNDCEGLCGI